jgi:hypothetical protein
VKSLRPKVGWPWTLAGLAALAFMFNPFWRPLNGLLGPMLFFAVVGLLYWTHRDEFRQSNR